MKQNLEMTTNFSKHSPSLSSPAQRTVVIQHYNSSNIFALYSHYPKNIISKLECFDEISFLFSMLQNLVRREFSVIQVNRLNFLKLYVHIVVQLEIWIFARMRIY